MKTIKFSHRYKKMPDGVEYLETWIKDIALIDYKDLTPEQIRQDTETVNGEFYKLPPTPLIWIKLWSVTEKFEYYSSLVGQQLKIEIS